MSEIQDQRQPLQPLALIDILFAIVLHISLADVVLNAKWFDDLWDIFKSPYYFHVLVLTLGYVTIILSWVGYHKSVSGHPAMGAWPFVCDVIMLFLYFLLFVKHEDFSFSLVTLATIFLLYFAWDQVRDTEFRTDDPLIVQRRGVTIFWFLVTAILAVLFLMVGQRGVVEDPGVVEIVFLVLAFVSVVGYRVHKEHRKLEKVLMTLGSFRLPFIRAAIARS